jgi:hydrogenase 3 maturation protease
LEKELRSRLKGKVVIAGVGNSLRGDDGAGPRLIERLDSNTEKRRPKTLFLFNCREVPENYLGPISRVNPDTIVIIDSADFSLQPGEVKIIETGDIREGGLSTHNASLKLSLDFLKESTKADIFLLGIQPKSRKLGEGLSLPVEKALNNLEQIFHRVTSGIS